MENAVGFIRRNLLVPVPSVGSLEELNGLLAAGCERLNAASRCRDGRPVAEALAEDLAAMAALVFSQAWFSVLSTDFFRVPARSFFGFRHGRAAASIFPTFPA